MYCNIISYNTIQYNVGKDADEMYEDVGHSNEARKTMKKYIIGSLEVQIHLLNPKPLLKFRILLFCTVAVYISIIFLFYYFIYF